ncbi:lysophospholipase [Deltaproteobacteria bacterium TL4]
MTALEALEQLSKKYGSRANVAVTLGKTRKTSLVKAGKVASQVLETEILALYEKDFSGSSSGKKVALPPTPKVTPIPTVKESVLKTAPQKGTTVKKATGEPLSEKVTASSKNKTSKTSSPVKKTTTTQGNRPELTQSKVTEDSHYFKERWTGLRLFYRSYLVEDAEKVLIVSHGLGEHSERYLNLVNYFAPRKTNLYLIDHRGHGRSQGQRGHVDSFNQYLDDFHEFVEMIRDKEPNRKLFLLGHSMGGSIAANYLIHREQNFAGAVLSSPAFAPGFPVPKLKQIAGALTSRSVPTLSLPTGLDSNLISHDPAVVKAYDEDPFVHGVVSSRWFSEYMTYGERAVNNADLIRCPVLIIQGSSDTMVSVEKVQQFYRNLTTVDQQMEWFEGYMHECFNEIGKEKVFEALERWLTKHI